MLGRSERGEEEVRAGGARYSVWEGGSMSKMNVEQVSESAGDEMD